MTSGNRRVGAVVLTYNSTDDLADCLACLKAQRGVDLRVIVVDNASRNEELIVLEDEFKAAFPGSPVVDATALPAEASVGRAVFLQNGSNTGYAAGNNIGARFASVMGCDAVLIINPDVRIYDPDYVAKLGDLAFADPHTAVATSAIHNLSGSQENPMTEASFAEEMLWPVTMLAAGLFGRTSRVPLLSNAPFRVTKVSGACFLIRTDFLRRIGFFDETVFLYCEESILMAQVRAAGWHMIMDPRLDALHAHRTEVKGESLPRFKLWAESRRRFHKVHGGYSPFRQTLLTLSRAAILLLIQGRSILNRLKARLSRMADGR